MTNKTTTQTTTQKSKTWSFQKVLQFCAYIGTACIAIALILSAIFKGHNGGQLSGAFRIVGEAIAYTLSVILAGFWVKRKKHVAWLICYIIFVVVIVVMYVVTLI